MAPNKFEKHIKDQLQGREIKPSTDAWNKLSEQLEEVQKPKKKPYFWYAVAASLVGILLVSTFYFNLENQMVNPNIQVVTTPEKVTEKKEDTTNDEKEVNPFQLVEAEEIEQNLIIEKAEEPNEIVATNEVLVLAEQRSDVYDEMDHNIKTPEDVINSKILEVVAQADQLEQQNDALTEVEVDSLLRMAQQEILNDKLFRSDRSVDAMALLSEVEDELDKSFRDQIFETLKSGFVKVRTAVADRNN